MSNPKFPIMQLDRLFYNIKQVLLISKKIAREPLKDTSFTPTKAIVVYSHGVFQDKISTARPEPFQFFPFVAENLKKIQKISKIQIF